MILPQALHGFLLCEVFQDTVEIDLVVAQNLLVDKVAFGMNTLIITCVQMKPLLPSIQRKL